MKTYLVTGGTGFIGRNVVRQLIKEGFNVKILDDDSRGRFDSLKDVSRYVEFVKGDIRDSRLLRNSCRGVDTIIHLASVNGTKFFYTMPEVVLDVSTRGIINIIDACLWHGIDEIYFASSSEVYNVPKIVPTPETVPMMIPDPLNPRFSYAGGKIISELMLLNYGSKYFRKVVIFRPHNVYGPEMGWEHVIPQFVLRMKKLSQESKGLIRFPIQGNGNESRSFVFIEDFIDGLLVLIKKGKHLNTYNIGTTEEISIKSLAKKIALFFDRQIKIIPGLRAPGGTQKRVPDISKIKKLGYNPKTSLKEGIKITARWYNDNAHLVPASAVF